MRSCRDPYCYMLPPPAPPIMSPSLIPTLVLTCVAMTARPAHGQAPPPGDFAWPVITRECKPWAYWWWLGSAVDEANLSKELARYQDAGMGGVHIIPIYGAKGCEDRYIEYLSPRWMEILKYTITEARKHDLGIDMTTGTGWCFGGPNISSRDASASVVWKTTTVMAGNQLTEKFDPKSTQALMAFADHGKRMDLTRSIQQDGTVDWTAADSTWTVYAISQKPNTKVKRAAPGGEGYMLNPYDRDALENYLQRFSKAFDQYDGPKPRAMYHDSFEYGVNWSPGLLRQFEQRRGYQLQTQLPAFLGSGTDDLTARVKADYRETVSDMMCENFIPTWSKWAHHYGMITRNQAHGSPANLLDLYAAADVPETEMFRTDRRPLIAKFASSAAHVAGHPRVAAETGTWLKEHFTETLADLKGLVDDMFVSGVNHVFYHGTCYSPDEAGWPGWLFYAATEMNPRNAFWRDVPALNAYIARCQAVLQSGQPDSDILLYWPIYDYWHNAKGMEQNLTIHGAGWFTEQPIGATAKQLWNRGYTFDYGSDRQLAASKTVRNRVTTTGASYQAIVVPACDHMPVATLENLLKLAKSGATVIFQDHLPADVPGLTDLEKRRAMMQGLLSSVTLAATDTHRETKFGAGRILTGELEACLAAAGMPRETMVDHPGIQFIRRTSASGACYFVSNGSKDPLDGWITLARPAQSVVVMDPLGNLTGKGRVRKDAEGRTQTYIQLQPGASWILRTFTDRNPDGPAWSYVQPSSPPVAITGRWQVKFLLGGPAIPKPFETTKLESWTTLGDEEARRFGGTASYSIRFDTPAMTPDTWMLDLGTVCESARVRLNGKDLGTRIMPPFRIPIGQLKAGGNTLEVEVTNLSSNRIRDLDIRGVPWRNFNDINFVNINYKPFDASKWPLRDSGLLGPVTLIPMSDKLKD